MGFFDKLNNTVNNASQKFTSKAQDVTELASDKVKNGSMLRGNGREGSVNQMYLELGKKCYELEKNKESSIYAYEIGQIKEYYQRVEYEKQQAMLQQQAMQAQQEQYMQQMRAQQEQHMQQMQAQQGGYRQGQQSGYVQKSEANVPNIIKKCAKCGEKLAPDAVFCSNCGYKNEENVINPQKETEIEEKKICSKCESILEEGVIFCPNCGNKVGE